MQNCIADLMCGGVRASPGGKIEKIVVAGGYDGGITDKVEVYNVATDTWVNGECHCWQYGELKEFTNFTKSPNQ